MEDEYDEFGNYIGHSASDRGSQDSSSDSDREGSEQGRGAAEEGEGGGGEEGLGRSPHAAKSDLDRLNQHGNQQKDENDGQQDDQHRSKADPYEGVEVIVHLEDTEPITEPIVRASKQTDSDFEDDGSLRILDRRFPGEGESEDEKERSSFKGQGSRGRRRRAGDARPTAFLEQLGRCPERIRNVGVCGHLHHGKTTLIDMVIECGDQCDLLQSLYTLGKPDLFGRAVATEGRTESGKGNVVKGPERATLREMKRSSHLRDVRFTDSRLDEQERGMTIKAKPVTLVSESYPRPQSYLLNLYDTPGHTGMMDDTEAALRVCDGVLLCVDVLEGPLLSSSLAIKAAAANNLNVVLVLTKIDRLVFELRLPPNDAYFKIRHTIAMVNRLYHTNKTYNAEDQTNRGDRSSDIDEADDSEDGREEANEEYFDVTKGNVVFCSARYSLLFTLNSFAELYLSRNSMKNAMEEGERETREKGGGKMEENEENREGNVNGERSQADRRLHSLLAPLATFPGTESTLNAFTPETLGRLFWGDRWWVPGTSSFVDKAELDAIVKQATADKDTKTIQELNSERKKRTFVEFVLEPLYKILSHCVAEEKPTLKPFLAELGLMFASDEVYGLETRSLLKLVCANLFHGVRPLVGSLVAHLPSPSRNARNKILTLYGGKLSTAFANNLLTAFEPPTAEDSPAEDFPNPTSPDQTSPEYTSPDLKSKRLVMLVAKAYPGKVWAKNYGDGGGTRGADYGALVRVMSGVLRGGEKVKILGPDYSLEDDEDMVIKTIEKVSLFQARATFRVDEVHAGNWAFIQGQGLGLSVGKASTIVSFNLPPPPSTLLTPLAGEPLDPLEEDAEIFRILRPMVKASVNVAVEPMRPTDLPQMIEGLRKLVAEWPACMTRVEECGDHCVFATGELAADCMLYDLRKMNDELKIRVGHPNVLVAESCAALSTVESFVASPNGKNNVTLVAAPLEERTGDFFKTHEQRARDSLRSPEDYKKFSQLLRSELDWDALAAKSLWWVGGLGLGGNGVGGGASGASGAQASLLLNDILPSQSGGARRRAEAGRQNIVHGVEWGCRQGPLIEEEVLNVAFKILNADTALEPADRSAPQVVPMARRATHSALLLASPRLAEPVYLAEILAAAVAVPLCLPLIKRRRGHVVSDIPIPGTPLDKLTLFLPIIDSFGFETELRVRTAGQAFVTFLFERFDVMQGDPLDPTLTLRPLEPSPLSHLPREIFLKTRKRKGLAPEIDVFKLLSPQTQALLESL